MLNTRGAEGRQSAPAKAGKEKGEAGRLRGFTHALIVSTIVFLVLSLLGRLHILDRVKDLGADAYMQLFRTRLQLLDGQTALALIDVDRTTYSRWNEPLLVPREKLACLVAFARTSGARIVLVDFDLTYPSSAEGMTAADRQLVRALANDLRDVPCADAGAAPPPAPVILQRQINFDYAAPETRVGRVRSSFLDGEVDDQSVVWAATTFLRSPDGVVRRWLLWELSCRIAGTAALPEVVPSIQLATLALQSGLGARDLADLSRRILEKCTPRDCTRDAKPAAGCLEETIGNQLIDFGAKEGRMLFTLAWKSGRPAPGDVTGKSGGGAPFVSYLPARSVTAAFCDSSPPATSQQAAATCRTTTHDGSARPANDLLKGRIAVIGGSYPAARDAYETPIGAMPGAFVIVNAVHSALAHGSPAKAAGWHQFVLFSVQAVLLAVVLCFVRLPLFGSAIAFLLLVVSAFVISEHILHSSAWVDASIASFSIYFYNLLYNPLRQTFAGLGRAARAICRRRALPLLLSLAGTLPVASAAEAAGFFGTVADYAAPSSNYELVRNGDTNSTPIAPLLALYEGDRIVFHANQGHVTIEQADGKSTTIGADDSPFAVPAIRGEGGRIAGISIGTAASQMLTATGWFIRSWWDDEHTRVTAVARGEEASGALRAAMFQFGPATVAAGERRFALRWQGGQPPFRVQVLPDGALAPIVAADGLAERSLPPMPVNLAEGGYQIEIRDATDTLLTLRFRAEPAASLPAPAARELDGLPADARTVAAAGWLAGRDDGAFAFESCLRVDGLAETYPPARGLRDALAAGRLPQQ